MFLLDHAAYCPLTATRTTTVEMVSAWERLNDFQFEDQKVLKVLLEIGKTSGVASRCLPPNLVPADPSDFSTSFEAAAAESSTAMVAVVEEVLEKTGVAATDIDILVTTSSTFHPVPSLESMLVNALKMRPDVKSYHLGCMACSAGAIGINLLQDLLKESFAFCCARLQANPNSTALFVPHENVTRGCYVGSDMNKFLANGLFGMGAAALVLTNKPSLARKAKYQLLHSVRAHVGQDDRVYRSMGIFEGDAAGDRIKYTADVPMAVTKGIRSAVAMVAPKVLSWGQLAAAAKITVMRKMWGPDAAPPYVPSFAESTVDHFLLHPGSHGLLKGFMKGLRLTVDKTLPSAAALRDYGNTSPSSTYYVLAYLESLVGVKKGQKLMQVSVGTGVKAGVNVWKALRDIQEPHPAWQHLQGVPVTEADLPLPLMVSKGEDSHADVAQLLKGVDAAGAVETVPIDAAAASDGATNSIHN